MVETFRTTFTTEVANGTELKACRLALGLSRKALAAKCGIHANTVQYWEGRQKLDWKGYSLKRMADALGLTILRSITRTRDHGVLEAWRKICWQPKPKFTWSLCGAKTRAGTPCKRVCEPQRKRCRLHGGLSTGPKTEAGKARIAEAQRRRWSLSQNDI